MPITVIYDANVLYPAPLRDLLIRLAQTSLVRARWTVQILDECFANLQRDRPDLDPSHLERTRALVIASVRDCLVADYHVIVDDLALPDSGDNHVLAAAICAGARGIVTFNLKHFPAATLRMHGIEAVHPDRFVLELTQLDPGTVLRVIEQQEAALRRARTIDILTRIERQGMPETAAALRRLRRGLY